MSGSREDSHRKFRRSEAFFGRRKSKALSPAQQSRYDWVLPKLRLDPADRSPVSAQALFDHQPGLIVLEIGFGGAEHLIHQAVSNPQDGFIGIEPFVNSMAKALRQIEERSLANIRLYDEDAVEILDWLPEGSVDRIDLLYPDPWPKMRHWKRRFVNPKNLDRIARVVRPGGRFHFASDIDTYVNWTLQHCDRHPELEWDVRTAGDWHKPFENWIRTRYEAKAVREGRTPCYLRFLRK